MCVRCRALLFNHRRWLLLVAECFDGAFLGGFAGGVESEDETDGPRDAETEECGGNREAECPDDLGKARDADRYRPR